MTTPSADPYWSETADAVLARLASRRSGLTGAEAASRHTAAVARPGGGRVALFLRQLATPITTVLLVAAAISFSVGGRSDAVIIVALVLASATIGFIQEAGAASAVARLQQSIRVTARVMRDGAAVDIPLGDVVSGDVVSLAPGDLVPADGVVLETNALLVDEAAITGESFPAEKSVGTCGREVPLGKRPNALSLGTHVVSGNCQMLAVRTGAATTFGDIAKRVATRASETDFERGVRRFGAFLLEVTLLLVLAIFAINVGLHRSVLDSLLFAVALAVGLTPQLLPAVVAVNLAHGARRMAERRVIVKHLPAIENLGAMTVLCTDKTGTLTAGTVELRGAEDVGGQPSERVLSLAAVNAHFASAGQSPIDAAIRAAGAGLVAGWEKIDEAPYDFHRKRLSVLARKSDARTMITKGAWKSVLAVCSQAQDPTGAVVPLETLRATVEARAAELGAEGHRVLGVATRSDVVGDVVRREDEIGMTLVGLVVLFDPPKKDVAATIGALRALGVRTVVVTGDAAPVATSVARAIGLDEGETVTGAELDAMTPEALRARMRHIVIAAEVEPRHKERLVAALRAAGEVTGFLGDGINDAPALHAADVGISVESASDVAKDAAAIVLLEKDLGVLAAGISEGRATFANTLKYVYMATSANFGNMFSMAGASLFLPFLPLLPKQILLTNLLTDLPEMTIATDRVDAELTERPRRWDVKAIRRFMIVFGLLSSVFDFATFGALLAVHASPTVLRTGWLVESVVSATMIVLVIRTRRPLVKSLPGRALALATAGVAAAVVALPFTPLAAPLGLAPLTLPILGMLAAIVVAYVLAAELTKRAFHAHERRIENRG